MQEYHCIPRLEEVLRGGSASRPGAEVVDESYGLSFEGDSGSTGCYEHDASAGSRVGVDEVARECCMLVESGRRRVLVEVVAFGDVSCALSGNSWSERHCEVWGEERIVERWRKMEMAG